MIVYCCSDLIFATKVSSTCEVMNVSARPARNLDMLDARLDRVDDGKDHDAVTCVMVDLELGDFAFELIKRAADHESKPRVIAFGPHVMTGALAGAERVGADAVMARGAFTAQLPELVAQYGS
ncbi:MAG: hypothetical protein AAF333_06995 [Planctomycetota bacterium]